MLSLYEASYLAFEGENLLEEAIEFTRMHLKDLKGDVSKSMAELVSHALEVPLHHRMLRLEARWYIEAYNKREDANSLLLELAKLDFNIVQSVLQSDLQDMSR
jgi:isoprene synthase